MKINIYIQNYLDTIDVFIDGRKMDSFQSTFSSNVTFAGDVEMGTHDIKVVNNPQITGRNWKKYVVFDWIFSDWTVAEKVRDTRIESMTIKVEVTQDVHINLELMRNGLQLTENVEDILDVHKQIELSNIAEKRIRNVYMLPMILLTIAVEICILVPGILLIANGHYIKAIIVFALAVYLAWLLRGMKK